MSNKNIMDELQSSMQINKAHSKEPNWMMAILKTAGSAGASNSLTKSNNTVVTKTKHALQYYAPISDHQFSLTRSFGNESTANSIMPDGGLTAHELKVVAPMASIEASVHEYFSQNVMVAAVHLIRLTTIGSTVGKTIPYHVIAEYMFNHLYISGVAVSGDEVCLAFRYASVSYTHNAINPLTAAQAGKSAAAYHNVVTGAGAASSKG